MTEREKLIEEGIAHLLRKRRLRKGELAVLLLYQIRAQLARLERALRAFGRK